MWLTKNEVGGGCAVGPYEWKHDGDVVEVPDDLGNDLLRLGGYEQAEAPKVDDGDKKPAARGRRKAGDDDGGAEG